MDKKTILLVDDSNIFLELERTFFKRSGCRILVARNGVETLKVARETHPDIILLDLVMPDMDGADTCRQLKEDASTRDIPVLIVSSRGDEAAKRRCFDAGAIDFVLKPLRQREIVQKVADVLDVSYRQHLRIGVKISVDKQVGSRRYEGYSLNLSEGGMFIRSEAHLEDGDLLELSFTLPDHQDPIAVKAQVVRIEDATFSRGGGFGVRFINLSPAHREQICQFIETVQHEGFGG